jgi:tetratricopeptide (TPR) repeat protein
MIFLALVVSANNAQPEDLHKMGEKGYALVLDMQFEQANKIFNEMVRVKPENALGHLLLALSYGQMWKINDFDDERFGKKYKEQLVKARDIAEGMLDKNEDDIDALFYTGCAYGNLGRFYMNIKKWFDSYVNGSKGSEYLQKVLEKDPDRYDAYLGIGMFHYYREALPNYSMMLFLVRGDVEGYIKKGINEITRTVSKGKYLSDEAKIILATEIYIEHERNYIAALPLLEELTIKYPNNYFLKLYLAECYGNTDNQEQAIQTTEHLIQSCSLKEKKYLLNRLYFNLGRAYNNSNEFEYAVMAFEKALEIPQFKARSLFYIGNAYEMMGKVDKARVSYNRIKKGDNIDVYIDARRRMNRLLTPSQINFLKGTNYLSCKEYEQAAVLFYDLLESEFKKEKPDKAFIANVYFNIGRVEYELKEYKKAINSFRKILDSSYVKLDYVKPWSHYYLANMYRKAGKTQKAKEEYDMAYIYNGKVLRTLVDVAMKEME